MKIDEKWKIGNLYKCPYCDKKYSKKGISTHIWRNHGDGKNHHRGIDYKKRSTNYTIWNKGLTKDTDKRVLQYSKSLKDGYKSGKIIPSFQGKKHTDETKLKISKKMSLNNNGGRCKWFEYKKKNGEVIKLQGTWEVRFAKVLDIIDKDWIKIGTNNEKLSLKWKDKNNKFHYYSPDFYSPKLNRYYEVKGYWWGEDKLKMQLVIQQNPKKDIEIVRKKQLQEYEKMVA